MLRWPVDERLSFKKEFFSQLGVLVTDGSTQFLERGTDFREGRLVLDIAGFALPVPFDGAEVAARTQFLLIILCHRKALLTLSLTYCQRNPLAKVSGDR